MIAKNNTFADYQDLWDALEPLGFNHVKPGKFTHRFIDREFDFTACSVHGAMKVLFDVGVQLGADSQQQVIR